MYRTTLKISIIFLYLIIIAGAIVRMTGSGMGCPDWPKCFGYYIPPTEEAQIQWEPNKAYKKGYIIIVEESLRIAPKDFTSAATYSESNWSTYDKHDYATFNVWQTWIEYINRQVTVLAGIPILLMIISAFWYWKRRPWLIFGSFFVLPLMGFEAWLGKQVVDSNLLPVKITIHLIAALVIVALLLYLWYKSQEKEGSTLSRNRTREIQDHRESEALKLKKHDPLFKNLVLLAGVLTLVQVVFGTQVRQYVDEQVIALGYDAKDQWLNPPTVMFYVHRSFSILVTLLNVYLFWRNRKYLLGHANLMLWILILIALEVVTGIAMYYIDFPFGTQPLHLVVASLLFGVQFYVYLESMRSREEVRTA
ncbi:COX15/CtaA family protein [uncultured Dokdonia sp.]|uniref:COX15/CtaA family protein n=1 Tax=uncultured Dokdonia sp. TaxID=575653 RepID=UPI002636C230|nr:COX15/CtaA family protein [uncultured Dokdonia sp.]